MKRMMISGLLKIAFPAVLMIFVTACNANRMEPYDNPFMVFTTTNSSSTSIDAAGTFDAQYYIHFSSRKLDRNVTVTVSVNPGDGLEEGTDYELITTGGKVTFFPGIYDMPFRIRWLKHDIVPSEDNTLTLRLETCDFGEVSLGMPGPKESMRTLVINKYAL